MSAKITNISVSENNSVSIIQNKDNEESIIFDVNISGSDYFFSSNNILFLNKDNKIIKANELVKGDQIYILKLNKKWLNEILIECENTDFIINLIDKLNTSNENIKIYNIIDSTNDKLNDTNCSNILNDNNNLRNKIIKELIYLGYDFSYIGTRYPIKTIEYIVANPDKYLNNLENYVYLELAKSNNTSIHNINRATTMMYAACEVNK